MASNAGRGVCSNCGEERTLSSAYQLCFKCFTRYKKMVSGADWAARRKESLDRSSRKYYLANREMVIKKVTLRRRAKVNIGGSDEIF